MLGFATLLFIVSPIAFLAGLVNPKWVLLGQNRTRIKSSGIYSGVFVTSLVIAGMAAPPQAKQENQPSPQIARQTEVQSPSPSSVTSPSPESEAETSKPQPKQATTEVKRSELKATTTVSVANVEPVSEPVPESASEAMLTASDPDSQINLRKTPSASGKRLGYGLVGDQVKLLKQTTAESSTWYKVKFPNSGAMGWIHGDFISTSSADETSQPAPESTPASNPEVTYSAPTVSASSGKCNFPDDLDSRGRRCGKRAASVRPGGN